MIPKRITDLLSNSIKTAVCKVEAPFPYDNKQKCCPLDLRAANCSLGKGKLKINDPPDCCEGVDCPTTVCQENKNGSGNTLQSCE